MGDYFLRVDNVRIFTGRPSRQKPPVFFLIGIVCLCAMAQVAVARRPKLPRGANRRRLKPIKVVDHVVTKRIDREAVRQADERRERRGGPFRFAIPRKVMITPWTDGTWEDLDDQMRLWRLHITCPGAVTVNLGFSRYCMPPGGSMYIYTAEGDDMLGPFTEDDNKKHGQLWTPVIHSDDVIVEVIVPASQAELLELELTSINHGYRGFRRDGKGVTGLGDSGNCNVNVACPEGDEWCDQIRSVAVFSFGGTYQCTGVLVNNTAQDDTPYFLTAYHCISNPSQATSMVIYWNYQSSTCEGTYGSNGQNQSGAIFRAGYADSDFVLVQLDDEPSMVFDVYYSGWDHSNTAPASAVGIHHPSGDVKKISFEDDPLSITSYLDDPIPSDGTHLKVDDWDLGTTEHVSSGSPIFDPNKHIVGLLHGGWASCYNDESDWYGRIYASWTGGGTTATRLSDWLDPNGISGTSLDGKEPGTDMDDLEFFSKHWLENNCNDIAGDETNWCFGTDLTRNGRVDLADFADVAARWLK
ncbi:MAG: hypothetical protein DRP65_03250 [Planctomycetota bacterium]|nr:MAG: hypothetical protein DRP65_03250 [Planctomycetota bacterium]